MLIYYLLLGLPSPRPHLLLGVIVRHKMKTGFPVLKKEKLVILFFSFNIK